MRRLWAAVRAGAATGRWQGGLAARTSSAPAGLWRGAVVLLRKAVLTVLAAPLLLCVALW